jgi:enamine deaminase RidA (YjgF/YER057c/UK114 family)
VPRSAMVEITGVADPDLVAEIEAIAVIRR